MRRELESCNKQHINPNDIASILVRLLSISDTITIQFKEKRYEWQNSCEARPDLVIFDNDIINNLKDSYNIQQNAIMSIRRSRHECQHKSFKGNNHTYSMQCGIIAVPKQLNIKYILTANFNISQLSSQFKTNLKSKDNTTNNNIDNDLHKDDILGLDSDDDDDNDDIDTDDAFENDDNVNNGDFINKVDTYYLNVKHHNNKLFTSSFGINDEIEKQILFDNSEFEIGDFVIIKNQGGRYRYRWGNQAAPAPRKGQIKWKGSFASDRIRSNNSKLRMPIRYGIELSRFCNGCTDGTYRGSGVRHFNCGNGFGYYARSKHELSINEEKIDWNNKSISKRFSNVSLQNGKRMYGFENDIDIINVCVQCKSSDKNKNGLILSFYKGNEYWNKIGNIEQRLDFDNFKYFFAISSAVCGCNSDSVKKNPNGFEYDIFLSRG